MFANKVANGLVLVEGHTPDDLASVNRAKHVEYYLIRFWFTNAGDDSGSTAMAATEFLLGFLGRQWSHALGFIYNTGF